MPYRLERGTIFQSPASAKSHHIDIPWGFWGLVPGGESNPQDPKVGGF
jgi:hypothetical protein